MDKNKKVRVFAYCDSPTCATGFSTVSRNIFEALYRTGRYDIDIFGINYWGDPHNFPYRIWPAGTNGEKDPYGRQKAVNMIPSMDFDILFLLQDSFIMDFLPVLFPHLRSKKGNNFKSILYFPVDSVLKEKWGQNIAGADKIVAYSEFGKREAQKVMSNDMVVIPHGVNTREFYPLPKEKIAAFRKEYFKSEADKFIITNLNRNQQRKDVPRTIQAFKEFRKYVPDSILYLHMAMKDQGWDLPEVCAQMGLSTSKDVIFPQNFGPNQGYPREVVNALYNCSDVVVSTTLGEGFGLSWIEAMAAKVPVVMPRNTAMTEFITEDRGYLSDSGTDSSLWTIIPHDNEVLRPLVDVDDMVSKLMYIYNNREEAKQKAENAYQWILKDMDWQGAIAKQWVKVFDDTYASVLRNEPPIIAEPSKIIEAEEV